jgi:hypothetical protein
MTYYYIRKEGPAGKPFYWCGSYWRSEKFQSSKLPEKTARQLASIMRKSWRQRVELEVVR